MIRLSDRIREKLREKEKMTRREKLKLFLPAIALTIIGFLVVYQFVDPAPPKQITIACGSQEGANFLFAKAYQEIMDKEGVTLNIRITTGSAENLKLLQAKPEACTKGVRFLIFGTGQ